MTMLIRRQRPDHGYDLDDRAKWLRRAWLLALPPLTAAAIGLYLYGIYLIPG